MTKMRKLHSVATISTDEKVHEIARRALAPPDFPFEGLHIEAALLLNQLAPGGVIPPLRSAKLGTTSSGRIQDNIEEHEGE